MLQKPKGSFHVKHTEKRSLFLGDIEEAADRATAEAVIALRRAAYPDASHVVYAFIHGKEKSLQYGMSDDGEPKGTAGRPVLEVLKGSGLTSTVLTVVRFFGGIKLGTGGLVRAYSEAARQCVAGVPRQVVRDLVRCRLTTPYEYLRELQDVLKTLEVVLVDQVYREAVELELTVERSLCEELDRQITDVSRGTVRLQRGCVDPD